MLEYPLARESSLTLAMLLLYNLLDTDEVLDNDVFYFNPFSADEDMPSFWLKEDGIEIAWHSDNPYRGASSNVEPTIHTAFLILDKVREWKYYATDPGGEEV